MPINAKIGVLGGDLRQSSLCRYLSESGFEVAVWGIEHGISDCLVRCVNWQSAVEKSQAVVLPFPSFLGGKYYVVSQNTGETVTLAQILHQMSEKSVLIGGKLDDVVKQSAEHHGIEIFDCFESEMLQIKNAIPTAEGAIAIALNELPITLNNAKTLVCGYGRIGKVLSRMLKSLGAKVFVSARNDRDIAYIQADGNIAVRLGSRAFMNAISNTDVIFNTVPAKIIDKTVIESIARCRLIVDLASGNGGIDFDAARKNGIKSIHALALPGKTAPETAGEIIAECILDMLSKKGDLP